MFHAIKVCGFKILPVELSQGDRMNTMSSAIGKMIRNHRQRVGLSIESLALSAGITPNYLGDVERGKKKPSLDTIERLILVMNISLQDFFTENKDLITSIERSKIERIMADINCFSDRELEIIHNIVRQLMKLKNVK